MPPGRFRSKYHIRRGMSPIWVPKANSGQNYFDKLMAVAGNGLIGYWMQNEGSGTVSFDRSGQGNNGAYTGVTLGVGGIGDGRTAASFDGTTSFNNIYSAGLAAAFNPSEGTLMAWAKVANAGVWTDGATRRFVSLSADISNQVMLYKTSNNNQLSFDYRAGGTIKGILLSSVSPATFFFVALTFSKSGDFLKAYYNGVKTGSTQTGVGTWSGALAATLCTIGSQSTVPAQVTSGSIAHVALWNLPLTAGQIALLYAV